MKKSIKLNISTDDLVKLIKSKSDFTIGAKLLCLLPFTLGKSSRLAAQENPLLSHNQLCILAKRFNKDGIFGLNNLKKTGRKSKINDSILDWLKKLVLETSPTKYNYNTETWTAALISEVLFKEHNIKYSTDNIYILLKKKLHLRHIKGKGFYPEANKEKRQIFIDELKKNY